MTEKAVFMYLRIHTYERIHTLDVGYPSVCYEYIILPLVNKESGLANTQAE